MVGVGLWRWFFGSGALRLGEAERTWDLVVRRISCATSSSGAGLRASSTTLTPWPAILRAKLAPIPSEPPAITAHGPYFSANIAPSFAAAFTAPIALVCAVPPILVVPAAFEFLHHLTLGLFFRSARPRHHRHVGEKVLPPFAESAQVGEEAFGILG